MALTDLKKKSQPTANTKISADDFIDDANNYAMGMPRIVSLRHQLPEEDDTTRLPMRHATFTLSQEAIEALNELSQLTGEPKSKLIRKLKSQGFTVNRDNTVWSLYVIELDPDVRFDKHKAGIQANAYVMKYGLRLLPDLYEGFNPMKYADAVDKEIEVGIDLRSAGFGVWQA
mgnify:CR=1 FL=1